MESSSKTTKKRIELPLRKKIAVIILHSDRERHCQEAQKVEADYH
jgi:hypothetical protein